MSLFAELKRRNVFRVGIAYLITAWLLLQVADVMIDNIGAPEWLFQAILLVLGIGFVIAIVFAWAFELTPDGIRRDSEVDHSDPAVAQTSQKLNRAIIVMLVLALAYFVWESRFASEEKAGSEPFSQAATQQAGNAIDEKRALTPAGPVSTGQSVAVLPFMNMSSDPEKEYFSDGITEEIINALVKVPGLAVPARTSVFAYKGRLQDVRQIGSELNVAHVLEGSIRSQGKQVRITAQLINVQSGYHLWSETFDRQLENIFAVQEEIAASIAEVLVGELGVSVAPVPNQTRDMEAYDLYLQGRAALRTREDVAIDLFEEVTRKDPDFAPGWAALAMAHNSVDNNDRAAIEAAEKALSMDPDNVDALNAMGAALRGLYRWEEAEGYLLQGLAIDPSSAELLEDWAEFLNFVGRTDEALEVTTRAMAIEPGLIPLQQEHTSALLSAGRTQEARELAIAILERRRAWAWYYLLPAWIIAGGEGSDSGQIPEPPKLPVDDETPEELVAVIDAISSMDLVAPSKAWGSHLRSVLESSNQNIDSAEFYQLYVLARGGLIRAGELDYVIEMDSQIDHTRVRMPIEWTWTPMLAPLRQHPEFAAYLEKIGLVDYWDSTSWPKWCQRDDDGVITCE
jgi:TolB-like protein/Flp pilus assembly protein TadD